jgi:hypothetical protein
MISTPQREVRALGLVVVAIASLGIAACDKIAGPPPLPGDAEHFSPPAVYSTWWEMTRACSGQTGSLDAVTWIKTNEVLHDPRTGEVIIGYFTSADNRIVMSAGSILDGGAVRHEMLHALLRKPGHPRDEFLGKCAGTVYCQGACVLDAGPYPTPPQTPIQLSADALELSVHVDPANPGGAQNDDYFTITVSAHNPSTQWVTIIPLFPDTDTTRSFSFAVNGPAGGLGGGEIIVDPSQRIFAPGETKKMVFDFRVGDDPFGRQLQPGSYTARGAFSTYWSNNISFVITP